MDIQTRDGILLRGIPDGTPDEAIKARINKIRSEKAKQPTAFETEARQILQTTPAELIAGHPLARFALGAARPILGAAQLGAEMLGDKTGSETLSRLEQLKQAGMRAYGSEGTDVIGIGGEVMSPVSLAAMRLPLASSAGGRIFQGGAVGTGFGLAAPVTEGDYSERKAEQVATGAALGLAIPGVIEGVGAGVRAGRNVIDPMFPGGMDRAVGRVLRDAAGTKTPQVMTALRESGELVPGSIPTAAEAAASAGSAEFSALQRIAEAKRPTAFTDIASSQEAARLQSIRRFGGDKFLLDAAKSLRTDQAKRDYGAAYHKIIKADPELAQIASDPYFKSALPAALDLAKSKGVDIQKNLTQLLHYVKLGLDDQLGGKAREAIAASEREAVQGLKVRLLDWMGRHNEAYDIARQNFAKASRPINEMQIGQELEKALTSALGTTERPAAFATARREAPRTITKATGQPRFESLEQVLRPENVQRVEGVASDLARKSRQEQLASAGLPRAKELVGQIEPEVPSSGMFSPAYSVGRAIINRLLGKIEGRALEHLAKVMEDPATAERVMRMTPLQRSAFIFNETGQKVSPALVVTSTIGSTQ